MRPGRIPFTHNRREEVNLNDTALTLLEGSYDLHVHTGPSHFQRLLDDFELLHTLDQMHMAGAVIKTHYGATQARAEIANRYAGAKAVLYGAVTLDQTVGGLNPYAVQAELLLGAKMIWLPTFHAKNHMDKSKNTQPVMAGPLSVLNEVDQLVPQVHDIIDLAKEYNAVINTGHISPKESYAVCLEAVSRGVKACLTHPDNDREAVPLEMQTELAAHGVFIDRSWLNTKKKGGISCGEMAHRIRTVSPARCIMSTDFGQKSNCPAPEGLLQFVQAMLTEGIAKKDIQIMIRDNPTILLDL